MSINIFLSLLAFLIYGSTLFFQPFKYQKAILVGVLFFTLTPFIFGFFPAEYSSDIFSVVLGCISVEVVKSFILKLYLKSKGIKKDGIYRFLEENGDVSYFKIYKEKKLKTIEKEKVMEEKREEEKEEAKEVEDEIQRKIALRRQKRKEKKEEI